MSTSESASATFFLRHEFAIRRIHSLLGIVPLGLYMVVHLATNASLMNAPETFQRAVYLIHSPGIVLPLIEWGFIFLPLIFHAVIGVWIARTGRNNTSSYPLVNNRRYAWQRWTGYIAFVYLFAHILHLHGWFHADWYLSSIRSVGLGNFRPYNAASTLALAMEGFFWPAFYLVGVLSVVYHLANGLWTAGITWGIWISPSAQSRATKVCGAIGVGLAILAVTAWWAAVAPDKEQIAEWRALEDRMYEAATESGMVTPNPHKRLDGEHGDDATGDGEHGESDQEYEPEKKSLAENTADS